MYGKRLQTAVLARMVSSCFGLPVLISAFSKLVTLSIPAARTGTLGERYLLSLAGPIIAEWVFVIGAFLALRRRSESLRSVGLERMGNWAAWITALLFAAITIASNLRFF